MAADRIELAIETEMHGPNGELRAMHGQVVTVLPGGAVCIENTAQVHASESETLARVGLRFRVPQQVAGSAEWYGRGPHENYCDRKRAAHVRTHHASARSLAEDLLSGYVYPQACGQRSDVRWLALRPSERTSGGGGGAGGGGSTAGGIAICGSHPLAFSLLPSSDEAIDAAAHPSELTGFKSGAPLHLTIDHRTMGVGGDVAWLRTVRPEYMVPDGTHRWAVLVCPLLCRTPPLPPAAAGAATAATATTGTASSEGGGVSFVSAPPLPLDLLHRIGRAVEHEPTSLPRRLAAFLLPAPPAKRAAAMAAWVAAAALVTSWWSRAEGVLAGDGA